MAIDTKEEKLALTVPWARLTRFIGINPRNPQSAFLWNFLRLPLKVHPTQGAQIGFLTHDPLISHLPLTVSEANEEAYLSLLKVTDGSSPLLHPLSLIHLF